MSDRIEGLDAPPATPRRAAVRRHAPVLVSVALSLVWTVLAATSPAKTYHLFPAVVAAAWPVTARSLRGPAGPAAALRAGVGGLAVAVLTALELAGLDALRGPAIVGGTAFAESLLAASAGAVAGAWALARPVTTRR